MSLVLILGDGYSPGQAAIPETLPFQGSHAIWAKGREIALERVETRDAWVGQDFVLCAFKVKCTWAWENGSVSKALADFGSLEPL